MSTGAESPSSRTKSPDEVPQKPVKRSVFWLSYSAVLMAVFLSALDLTAVSTALPTITEKLEGADEFVWVGSAYALANTAFLPLSGNLSDIFGQPKIMLLSVIFFAVGSAICGAARNMEMLIAGRAVQGIGGGGILNLSDIILSDIVPLAKRGRYQGIVILLWCFAFAIGPLVGGSLAERASWRWLFYLNLPVCGITFVFMALFLRLKTPEGSIKSKLLMVDWGGNIIVIAGITLANIGFAWGGVRYEWSDPRVLGPLISGLGLIGVFIVYEKYVPSIPTLPWDVISNRTSLSAYGGTFVHGITSISTIYYLPVYFQSTKEASPIRSAIQLLPSALVVAPFALVGSLAVQYSKGYVPVNYVGWMFIIIGFGILTLLESESPVKDWVGFQIVAAVGSGVVASILWSTTIFPVLAPVPTERNAAALTFFAFVRAFAQAFGITICATILQNELRTTLPAEFIAQYSSNLSAGVDIAYSTIPRIPFIEEPLHSQVKNAFGESLKVVWQVMIGIGGLGLLTVLPMREIKMHEATDEKYRLKAQDDQEKDAGAETNTTPA